MYGRMCEIYVYKYIVYNMHDMGVNKCRGGGNYVAARYYSIEVRVRQTLAHTCNLMKTFAAEQ